MRVLMLVWTDIAHDARVLREVATVVGAGHTVHVIGRAVPPDWRPPEGVTVSSARARSPFRRGSSPSAERSPSRGLPQGRSPARTAAAALRWLLLPHHVEISIRTWQHEAYSDARKRQFDVVHAHDFTTLPLGERLAREHDVPLLYDAHEWWPGRARHGRWEPLRRARQAGIERRLARRAFAVLTVSDGIAQRFRAWGVPHVTVIRNTFPLQTDAPTGSGLHGLLYAGRVAEGRDLRTAIAAAPLDGIPLVLMGPADPGFLPPSLPAGVQLLPTVSVDRVDDALREIGAALVSLEDSCDNHRLALPNKVFHAVRAGVPVVAADLPELSAVVRRHHLGTLYTPGDVGSLNRAVSGLADRYDEYLRATVAARGVLRWEADSARLAEVYARVAASAERAAAPTAD